MMDPSPKALGKLAAGLVASKYCMVACNQILLFVYMHHLAKREACIFSWSRGESRGTVKQVLQTLQQLAFYPGLCSIWKSTDQKLPAKSA